MSSQSLLSMLPKELLQQLQAQQHNQQSHAPTKADVGPSPSASVSSSSTLSTSSPFGSIANFANAPSFSSFGSLAQLTHLSELASSDNLNFLLSSNDQIHAPADVHPSAPSSLTFEELFKQQQNQMQNSSSNIVHVSTTKIIPQVSESDVSTGKSEGMKMESITNLSQTLAKWGDYNKPNEEIIGQIIQKQSAVKEEYIDVSPYITFPQHEAARKLGIPSSTLSKKWKDATVNRKWPYRALAKIDKEIATIMHNIPKNADGTLESDVENQLGVLLRKRAMEARAVIIRLN